MSWELSPPTRRRRRLLFASAAVLMFAAAAAFLGLQRGSALPRAADGPLTSPAAGTARGAVPAAEPGAAPLRLPAPRLAAGFPLVPLGFPHTALGAASAAWRWTQVLYGLDPARASAAASACADPTFLDAPRRAARTALAVRASLGVAATGPANPAYLVVTPRMVQVIDPDPDFPVVGVLATADLGSAGGARLHRVQVLELHLHWTATGEGGDYRLLDRDGDPTRVAGLAADHDTPAAHRLGWRDVVLLGVVR